MSKHTRAPTRRQRERLHHKQEILSAALRLFAAKGFQNVSMQEIASEAEFAVGTMYNFFASKEALFDELVADAGERIVSSMASILDQPGTEAERLAGYFRSLSAQLEEHALLIKFYILEAGARVPMFPKGRSQSTVKAVLTSKLCDLIGDGIRNGHFRRVHPDIAVIAITSTLETLAFQMAGNFDKAMATKVFAKVEQFFLNGLLKPKETRG